MNELLLLCSFYFRFICERKCSIFYMKFVVFLLASFLYVVQYYCGNCEAKLVERLIFVVVKERFRKLPWFVNFLFEVFGNCVRNSTEKDKEFALNLESTSLIKILSKQQFKTVSTYNLANLKSTDIKT